ncbi:hypothetical protein SteCoe_20328 [Stentor coeruleus]|uniref:Uncharacterized protein n=1 Tax=Stentor coeruleus TaxID=5963 RepID=A0A1R2BS68_9CILI|nr:hypothetical protein SteCoe_20328 [Stentor coeruleus]
MYKYGVTQKQECLENRNVLCQKEHLSGSTSVFLVCQSYAMYTSGARYWRDRSGRPFILTFTIFFCLNMNISLISSWDFIHL